MIMQTSCMICCLSLQITQSLTWLCKIGGGIFGMKKYIKNPIAKDLRQPKYKPRVVPDKKKPKRKPKHKENFYDYYKDKSIQSQDK